MSAQEVIEQIQHLSPVERAQVIRFVVKHEHFQPSGKCAVAVAGDGLPVIRASGGVITSQLVHELESLTP